MLLGEGGGRRNVLAREDEDVRRCTRRDVPECNHQIVGMHLVGGDLAGSDPAEQAVSGHQAIVGATLPTGPWLPGRPTLPRPSGRSASVLPFGTPDGRPLPSRRRSPRPTGV